MSLHVLEPGWATRVVDLGRPGTRSLGVPVGGAADRASLMLGNALVGNPPDAAALEITVKGPRLRAAVDLACVLFGAPFEMFAGDRRVPAGTTFTLHAGEEASIAATPTGMRAYFCVTGGLDVPRLLGSRSSLDNLVVGTILPCRTSMVRRRRLPLLALRAEEEGPLRVVIGLQASWFREQEFYEQEFVVKPASNRMGLRLESRPLTYPEREMVSEPVSPGAVQVTRDGQCIVLGVDGQTIGGYPKIAQVIAADLDRLGQLRPGARVTFRKIELDEAIEAFRGREQMLNEWLVRSRVSLDGWGSGRTL